MISMTVPLEAAIILGCFVAGYVIGYAVRGAISRRRRAGMTGRS
jgi:hypothetical protein